MAPARSTIIRRRVVAALLITLPVAVPVALAAVATVVASPVRTSAAGHVATTVVPQDSVTGLGPMRLAPIERVAAREVWTADESARGTRPDASH